MKTKTKHPTLKASPRIKALAEHLFDVGIAGWNKADSRKGILKFKSIDHPGQIAAWYAIAKRVDDMIGDVARSFE